MEPTSSNRDAARLGRAASHFPVKTFLLAVLLLVSAAAAAPFRPNDDRMVLETLPKSFLNLRQGPASHSTLPADRAGALERARKYLEIAVRTSDPAFINYAEGAIEPWLGKEGSSPDLLYLHAMILQHRHAFAESLEQLERLLTVTPADRAALLAKASVLTTLGRLQEAREVFRRNPRLATDVEGLAILANITGLSGALKPSRELLRGTLDRAAGGSGRNGAEGFAWTVLAEMSVRAGDPAAAEVEFKRALSAEPENAYTQAVYADFLLRQNRAREVERMIDPSTASDALILRRLLAERALGAGGWKSRTAVTEGRFRQSGHWRELAILQWRLEDNPKRALESALTNWEKQREAIDARLLLETARAAGRPDAAEPARRWIVANGCTDLLVTEEPAS